MVEVRTVELAYNRVYIVDGPGGRLLVDTGPDYAGAWEALQVALDGQAPDLLVATHGHMDHAGMGARWRRAGVPVAIGGADLRFAHGPAATSGDLDLLVEYARASGAPPEVEREAIATLDARKLWARLAGGEGYPKGDGRWPTGLRYEAFEPDLLLASDADITGDAGVVLCPGHTPGNLVVVSPEAGLLFSGDQLLPDITPTPALQYTAEGERFPSLPRFVESMRKLQAMEFEHCYPGHGEAFASVSNVIAANLDQVEQRTDRVYSSLVSDGPARIFELAERLYQRAARRRFWQVVSTIQGHVDVLVEEGMARVEDEGMVVAL